MQRNQVATTSQMAFQPMTSTRWLPSRSHSQALSKKWKFRYLPFHVRHRRASNIIQNTVMMDITNEIHETNGHGESDHDVAVDQHHYHQQQYHYHHLQCGYSTVLDLHKEPPQYRSHQQGRTQKDSGGRNSTAHDVVMMMDQLAVDEDPATVSESASQVRLNSTESASPSTPQVIDIPYKDITERESCQQNQQHEHIDLEVSSLYLRTVEVSVQSPTDLDNNTVRALDQIWRRYATSLNDTAVLRWAPHDDHHHHEQGRNPIDIHYHSDPASIVDLYRTDVIYSPPSFPNTYKVILSQVFRKVKSSLPNKHFNFNLLSTVMDSYLPSNQSTFSSASTGSSTSFQDIAEINAQLYKDIEHARPNSTIICGGHGNQAPSQSNELKYQIFHPQIPRSLQPVEGFDALFDDTHNFPVSNAQLLRQAYKRSSSILSNAIGRDDVLLQRATAHVKFQSNFQAFLKCCMDYAKRLENEKEILRVTVMSNIESPASVTLLVVYPFNSDAAFFDKNVADEYIDNEGWKIDRLYNIFPDLIGWMTVTEIDNIANQHHNKKKATSLGNFSNPETFILSGVGSLQKATRLIHKLGRYCLIITGFNQARLDSLLYEMDGMIECGEVRVDVLSERNGSMHDIKHILDYVMNHRVDCIIGHGSGSSLDVAKAVSKIGGTRSKNEIDSILSKIQQAADQDLMRFQVTTSGPKIPLILIPSVNGSGTETAESFMLTVNPRRAQMQVDVININQTEKHQITCIVEPRLPLKMLPGHWTCAGGLASIATALESFVAINGNHDTNSLAAEVMSRAGKWSSEVIFDKKNLTARERLCEASFLAGLVRESTGLGPVSTMVLAFGNQLRYSVCLSRLVPAYIRRVDKYGDREKLNKAAQFVLGSPAATGLDLEKYIRNSCTEACLHNLRQEGVTETIIKEAAKMVIHGRLMKAVPSFHINEKFLIDMAMEALDEW